MAEMKALQLVNQLNSLSYTQSKMITKHSTNRIVYSFIYICSTLGFKDVLSSQHNANLVLYASQEKQSRNSNNSSVAAEK